MTGAPIELIARTRRVGDEHWRIAGTTWSDMERNIAVGDLAHFIDQLAYRPALSGANIECRALTAIEKNA
jgi:hypothetical protein